ncbi:LacI family transcriptional regulator [Curtobacterium flaccumfaciens pv. flaccumfaciens]|uniref:LacI family DNA-binding transcriptional regulator n=1 Tax=Curtobacterium flaccumfaciens TaxID=2035 RepID=UPI001BDE12AE|nr:LacI family DNA-binding transcriptional regulator [Curtobacterium flaccumfaciens]MBT1669120.1 LacI family transcriptional regulator [Curtobacterium flaccumfaciens pv. flaccumfaciens]
MAATLRDVAERCAISRSLVSLALRGDDGVSRPRRELAVRTADELGLPVGSLARRRAQGAPLVLGVVVTEAANPFHDEALRSARATAQTLGFALRVVDGFRDPARLVDGLEALHTSRGSADGVLGVAVLSSRLAPARLAAVARDLPVAVLGSSGSALAGLGLGLDTVCADEESGMRALVLHLAALGHRRTCFVAESGHPSTTRRAVAHAAVTGQLGAPGEHRVDDVEALAADPARIARHLGDGVTAFVATNDATAARLVSIADGAGLALPRMAAVTGFDGTGLGERLDLTSVDQPRVRMGARAVELVVERLRGRRGDRHEVLPTRLLPRGSTARAVAGHPLG